MLLNSNRNLILRFLIFLLTLFFCQASSQVAVALNTGDYVGVNGTNDLGLSVRDEAGTSGTTKLKIVPDGWAFKIIDGPIVKDNYTWWKVRDEKHETSQIEGWTVENYLVKVSSENLVPPDAPDYFYSNQSKIEDAINQAKSQVGKTAWKGLCLKFVREAFEGELIEGWSSAEAARQQLENEGKFYSMVNCWNPPRGALIFFSYELLGHVGIYLGDQGIVHSYDKVRIDKKQDNKSKGIVTVENLSLIDSYIGWAYPPQEWMETPVQPVTLKVSVKYPNENLVNPPELNALVLYKELYSNSQIVEPVSANPYTFSDLEANKNYLVEAYVNDMLSGKTDWINLGSGASVSETITTKAQGRIKVKVYYSNGSTPLSGANVEVRSHEGTAWRSDTTNNNGETTWFWLQPTTKSGEYYKAYAQYNNQWVGNTTNIELSSGQDESVSITTSETLSQKKILSVPYYYQGDTNWCVPASMAMIFKYYYGAEKNIHSWDIAKEWNWSRDIQWWQLLEPTYGMIRDYFNNHGLKTAEKISDAQDFYEIKARLDIHMPVILYMRSVEHAVVVVGYSLDGGSKKVYINDPSGKLMLKFPTSVVGFLPYITVELDWNDVAAYTGGTSYAIAVGSPVDQMPSTPPKGTIDVYDFPDSSVNPNPGVGFWREPADPRTQVYAWLYGEDKGLVWKHTNDHSLALDSRDNFQFYQYIHNHMEDAQKYGLEIEFANESGSTPTKRLTVPVEPRNWATKLGGPEIMEPIHLPDLLQDSGEYTLTLRLWNEQFTEKYDEIVFPPLEYNDTSPDTIPPEAVTDLEASNPADTQITLSWTAPGDDGDAGTASEYDIRYSNSPITEANWNAATQCEGEPSPKVAGSSESFVVTSLSPETTYYFAMKTADEVPNWSNLSNVAQETTSSDSYQTIYSEDFSSDPNFTSLAPEYAYWDAEAGNYYVKTFDNSEHKYCALSPPFGPVDVDNDFTIEFSVMFENQAFGTYPRVEFYSKTGTGPYILTVSDTYSSHHYKQLKFKDRPEHTYFTDTIEDDVWYNVKIDYHAASLTADLYVYEVDSGNQFYLNKGVTFEPPENIRYLWVGYYGSPPQYGNEWSPIRLDDVKISGEVGVSEEPSIAVSPDSIDFGDVSVGNHADEDLLISNDGDADLTVNSITSDNSAFTIVSPTFPQNILPGNNIDVTVRFSPSSEGSYTGTLTIASNDPDAPELLVSVKGTGIQNFLITDDLVAYWNFGINTNDLTANGNDLTNHGATSTSGKINGAYDFERTELDYMYISDTDQVGLDLADTDFTLASWVKIQSPPATDTEYALITKWDGTATTLGYTFQYRNESGTKKFFISTTEHPGRTGPKVKFNYDLGTGTWHHVAVTWDESLGQIEMFVNGDSLGISSILGGVNTNDSEFRLGCSVSSIGGTRQELDGVLDEIGIWSRKLSEDEIKFLYNNGAGWEFPTEELAIDPDPLDFGIVRIGKAKNKSITITNNGDEDAEDIQITCDNEQVRFDKNTVDVPASGSTQVDVTITASTEGQLSATIYTNNATATLTADIRPLFGDVSEDGEVTAYDASLVLQSVVGLIELSSTQQDLADVTGNDSVTAYDAAMILQYTVELIAEFPVQSAAPNLALEDDNKLLTKIIASLENSSLSEEHRRVLEKLRSLLRQKITPEKTALLQNYPNPFNPETWIPFELAERSEASITIYDATGQMIRTIRLGELPAGVYTSKDRAAHWDGRNQSGERVSSGVYFYTIQAGEYSATKRMLILK